MSDCRLTAMAGVWRQLTAWILVLFPVQLWLCLGGLMSLSVEAQSKCGPSMCERPLSTVKSSPLNIEQSNCHHESSKITVLCNLGFRQNGDNYTAECVEGVWVPGNGCQIDILAVIVSASAALVAILIFSLVVTVVCSCQRASKKQKRHSLSKIQGKPKKNGKRERTTDNEVAGAANGQGFANGAYTTNPDDDYIDDFSDDEDDTVPSSKQPIPESIYQNHTVIM
ncbi:uncharacterized protein LOC117304311 [Asterias rubens]|uniref:uncharacterized protein LOC117304311 n=1 Tax=Asterias rubens TaxID=7604 RepID=UPI0014558408|nr:uncharacterized protein LOC117304311 [Asterias rubens]